MTHHPSIRRGLTDSALLACALALLTGGPFAVPQGYAADAQDDPNFPQTSPDLVPPSALLPIWQSGGGHTILSERIPQYLLFAKDHSVGYYLGYNARGSWIRHENGTVYVFDAAHGTLVVGASSLSDVPADLQHPAISDGGSPRRVSGYIARAADGTATLTYDLIEQGKPPRKMHFTGLVPAGGVGAWAWIGDPAEGDPVAIAAISDDERLHLQSSAPGEAPGSAGVVNVDSAGDVEWTFGSRIFIATHFARGDHGRVAPSAEGGLRLAFTLHVPGRVDRALNLPVSRPKIILNPPLERLIATAGNNSLSGCLAGSTDLSGQSVPLPLIAPPALDLQNALVWTGTEGRDYSAIAFNLHPDGSVLWNLVGLQSAQLFLAGPTPADAMGPGPTVPAAQLRGPAQALAQRAAVDDPNLPRSEALEPLPYHRPVRWQYWDSGVPAVWHVELASGGVPGGSVRQELVYLGFDERGSWLSACDGTAVYVWNGQAEQLARAANNLAAVPLDLQNPSDFMRRYAQRIAATATPSAVTSVASTDAVSAVDPLQAVGLIPGDTGPSTFAAPIGNSSGGTSATVRNGLLTYVDAQSGAHVSLKVRRPAYMTAQPLLMKSAGITGPWIWLSDDAQQGRIANVTDDGAVKVTVVSAQIALTMLGQSPQ